MDADDLVKKGVRIPAAKIWPNFPKKYSLYLTSISKSPETDQYGVRESLSQQAVDYTVALPVIWNTITLMGRHCNGFWLKDKFG